MNRSKVIKLVGIISIIAIAVIGIRLTPAKAESEHDHHGMMMGKKDMKKDVKESAKDNVVSLEQIHSKHLPMVAASIEKVIEAVETGNSKDALAELHRAQKMIAGINKAIGKHIKPTFVNSKCPIWGAPIEPKNVTDDLIRGYKGSKVAFCCADCPPKWDKLTDAEKDTKLAKTKEKSAKDHSEHKMH